MTSQQDVRTPETFFAIRRTDGEQIGDYAWLGVTDANDWAPAEDDSEWADDIEGTEYEMVEMTVRPVAKKRYPENPHEEVKGECDYCGEPWPCEWVQEREKATS